MGLAAQGEAPIWPPPDGVPFKPRGDVILAGTAYAPRGGLVRSMDVSLRVGKLQKTLRVVGDRKWWYPSKLALVPGATDPEPFTTMPLTYARAYGGTDEVSASWYPENPTGRGFIGRKTRDAIHGKPLPNIEDPADSVTSWDSRPKLPAGFDFYGEGWLPRRKYAGTYDAKWQKERPDRLPADFSPAFFNAAHPDLQVEGYLRGDEDVELRGVTPDGLVKFRLPGVRPKITVLKWTEDPDAWVDRNSTPDRAMGLADVPTREEVVPAHLDTLVFLPDQGIYHEVFRGVCALNSLERAEVAEIRVEEELIAPMRSRE